MSSEDEPFSLRLSDSDSENEKKTASFTPGSSLSAGQTQSFSMIDLKIIKKKKRTIPFNYSSDSSVEFLGFERCTGKPKSFSLRKKRNSTRNSRKSYKKIRVQFSSDSEDDSQFYSKFTRLKNNLSTTQENIPSSTNTARSNSRPVTRSQTEYERWQNFLNNGKCIYIWPDI